MRLLAFALLVAAVTDLAHAAPAADPPALSCRGEEPFWGLETEGTSARFSEPGLEILVRGEVDELSWLPPGWIVWRSAPSEPRVIAVLRQEACLSTMTDEPWRTHRAVLVRGSQPAAAGCCTVTIPRPRPD